LFETSGVDPTLFEFYDRNYPVYVVYLLRFECNVQLLCKLQEPSGNKFWNVRVVESFTSDWMPENDIDLFVEGCNMYSIYEFFPQIAGSKLKSASSENCLEYLS
jgi:hypothetical protein